MRRVLVSFNFIGLYTRYERTLPIVICRHLSMGLFVGMLLFVLGISHPPHGDYAYAQNSSFSNRDIPSEQHIGMVNTPEDFDRLLRALGSPDTTEREEAAFILEQMGEIAIPALIQLGLWNPDPLLRENAIAALARIGPPAREPLAKALKDKEVRVRAGAAKTLGLLADPITAPPLINTLGDKTSVVRQEAFSALSSMGPMATSDLIRALAEPHPGIRRNAAVLLQRIGRPAVSPLIRALTSKNPDMRVATARILGQIGDTVAISPLVQTLRDPQGAVREQAIMSLAQFQQRAVGPLIKVLEGQDPALYDGAFSALQRMGHPAISALARFIQKPQIAYPLRARAGQILRQQQWTPQNVTERVWGNIVTGEWNKIPQVSQALSPLMTTMGEPLEEIRKSASKALVPFGARAVTVLATEILRRKDPFFLQSAAEALGEIHIRDFLAVEALTRVLQNRAYPVQEAVIQTLGKIGNYIAIEPLLGIVEDKSRPLRIRILAVEALEKLSDPRVTPRLVMVLERVKTVPFQKTLIYTLGQLARADAAPVLIKWLANENPTLRKVSGEAIIKLRPLPVASLIDSLADSRPLVQKMASSLLSQIGEPAVEQLITTLKKRDAPPGIKAQAELLLVKVLEALPGNVDVLIKALEAPSDRVRLLAVESLSEIKTAKAIPSLLDIAEQEWHYSEHLRKQAQRALANIKGNVSPEEWKALVTKKHRSRFEFLSVIGKISLRIVYALLGYWLIMSLVGLAIRGILPAPRLRYGHHLLEHVWSQRDEPVSRSQVQKGLRAGFSTAWGGIPVGLLVTGGIVAACVWGRMINSITGTFYIWGALFIVGLWLQSRQGAEGVGRLLDRRKQVGRLMLAPLTYLGRLLFPITEDVPLPEIAPVSETPIADTFDALSQPSDESQTSFAMLLESFSRSERIDILQVLGEHAAGFPPTDPQDVLNIIFKESYEQIRSHEGLNRKEDIRAFLATLVPMAMALSRKIEEVPETLSKMLALVGTSNSLVKLERFFSEVLGAVEHAVLKGAFPIILELLQTGFFPTTELIEEARTSDDRQLLYYSWREIVSSRIQKGQFNLSDPIHLSLHFTAFRQRANHSRILNLLGYIPHYADYTKIVDQWKKGSQKNTERVKHLREIADQFNQFIQNIEERNMVLAGPWLTRRLQETFGGDSHPANWLFIINKTGVSITSSFLAIEPKIPEKIHRPMEEGAAESPEAVSVDAFDALMSQ